MKASSNKDLRKEQVAALRATLEAGGGQAKVRELYQLLTAEETADFLALDLGTVRNLTYRHELPCVKIGRRGVRYRLLDLIAWQDSRSYPALN